MVKAIKELDYVLIFITTFLIVFGIVILASASTSIPKQRETIYYLLKHQIFFALVPGVFLALLLATKIKLQFLKKTAPLFLLISLGLMTLVFLPGIGKKSGTAARWISFKYFSFQPSELLKLTFVLYLASWLESKSKKTSMKLFGKRVGENLTTFLIIIALITLLLYLQSDVGTLGVILVIAVLMYFFAKTPLWHIGVVGLAGIVCLFLLIRFTPYRLDRILVFLNPETDPMGKGYQIKQALIAIGSGKVFGLGFGMSQQKFGLLPHSISDSIFGVLAEETGFVGSVFLIFLFLLFLWKGYKIAKESKNMFSKLTALGITSWIIVQAFVNIGSMIGILPLTGIPLPFVSYGGSALLIELAGVGILLNIARTSKH